ncbi:MAG: MarR family winged helix-turn-helix transcriptional regulator [Spirochaetota bacterium]
MSRNLDLHSRELEREYGLTVPQLNVLWAVGASHRVPIGQVADRISLSGATVTSIVDRLEEHDLVKRERSTDDKRQVLISLTDKGRDVLAGGPQPFHDCFVERLGRLERWQQTELLSSIQHVADMMEPDESMRAIETESQPQRR